MSLQLLEVFIVAWAVEVATNYSLLFGLLKKEAWLLDGLLKITSARCSLPFQANFIDTACEANTCCLAAAESLNRFVAGSAVPDSACTISCSVVII